MLLKSAFEKLFKIREEAGRARVCFVPRERVAGGGAGAEHAVRPHDGVRAGRGGRRRERSGYPDLD